VERRRGRLEVCLHGGDMWHTEDLRTADAGFEVANAFYNLLNDAAGCYCADGEWKWA